MKWSGYILKLLLEPTLYISKHDCELTTHLWCLITNKIEISIYCHTDDIWPLDDVTWG